MAQPTLDAGSKRERQMERICDVLLRTAQAQGLAKLEALLTQNRRVVKQMLTEMFFPAEVQRPTVDWPDGPPPEVHPSEWSPVDRAKGNVHALSAISNVDKYTQAELQEAAAEYSGWVGLEMGMQDTVQEAIEAAREAGRPLSAAATPRVGEGSPLHRAGGTTLSYATAPLQEGVWKLVGRLHDKGLIPGDDPPLALLHSSEFERGAPSGLKINAFVDNEIMQEIVEARGGWRNRPGQEKKLTVICPVDLGDPDEGRQHHADEEKAVESDTYELVISGAGAPAENLVFPVDTACWQGWDTRDGRAYPWANTAPGGVEIHVYSLRLWASEGAEETAFRERMLRAYYFLGAYVLPKGLGLNESEPRVIALLKKREGYDSEQWANKEIDAYDRPIVEGLYFRTTGRNNTAGPWILPDEGDETEWWRYGVTGPFVPDALRKMRLRPLLSVERAPVERPRRAPSEAREDDRRPRKDKRRAEIKVPASARLMGSRITSWREMAHRNAQIASNGVDELEDDLRKYLELNGNPHEAPWAASVAPEVQALLQAVLPDGTLSPDIFSKDFQRTSFRGDKNDVVSVVKWMCERVSAGVSWGRVLEIYEYTDDLQKAMEDQVKEDNKVNVVWNDGNPTLYTDPYFLSGDLYVHLDAMEADDPEWIHPFYERQRSKLLDLIEPQNVMQMNITLRDPLVPIEALNDYFSALNQRGETGLEDNPYEPVPEDRRIVVWRENGFYGVLPAMSHFCIQEALRYNLQEDQIPAAEAQWAADGIPRAVRARCHRHIREPVRMRIALMNRSSTYRDEAEHNYQAWRNTRLYPSGDEVDEKVARDALWDSQFQTWIAGSEKWGPIYADIYNRAVRGTVPPPPDDTDLGLCRVGPAMMHPDGSSTLYDYQTEAVRKVSRVGGGLVALDVGLGKTFTATALLAYWRQLGQAKRPIIAVPKQVLLNWKREINSLLPDYDVLVVGSRMGRGGKPTDDSPEEKAQKWRAWARGEYDVCVCTKDNFQDVRLTPPELLEMLNQSEWLRHIETRADFYLERLREDVINQKRKVQEAESDRAYELAREVLETAESYILKVEEPKLWAVQARDAKWQAVQDEGDPKERYNLRRQYQTLMRTGEPEQFEKRDPETDQILRDEEGRPQWERYSSPGEFVMIMEHDQRYIMGPSRPKAESEELIRQQRRVVEEWHELSEEEQAAAYPVRFSDMNCDLLIADESHKYKNLWKAETRYGSGVRFLAAGKDPVAIAVDFFVKSAWVRTQNNQRGIVELTATPVTNSPLEIYNQIYCIAEQDLQARGLGTKELFVDRFCRIEYSAWVNTRGHLTTGPTVTQFQNMDELRQTLSLYMEFKTLDDVNNPALVVPESDTTQVFTPMTGAQETIYDFIRTRFGEEGISTLAILAEAQDASLDQTLIWNRWEAVKKRRKSAGPASQVGTAQAAEEAMLTGEPIPIGRERQLAPDELYNALHSTLVPPKFAACAREILKRPGCGHVVFLDRKGAHPMLIEALVDAGIERGRIGQIMGDGAFVGSKSVGSGAGGKEKVADALNGIWERDDQGQKVMVGAPQIDVLIGTASMAEGMNLQMRGCAIHHLDLPWTSAIVQQRNGRAVRQGNVWAKQTGSAVDLLYYIALRSADSIRMQAVMGKKGWISTLFESTGGVADNPMMDAPYNEEAVIELFSLPEDYEANIRRLTEHRANLFRRRVERGRKRLQKQFRAYSLILNVARTTSDSAMAKTIFKQAGNLAVGFEAVDDAIWGANRYVIEMARDKVVSWTPPWMYPMVEDGSQDFVIIEGEAATTNKSYVEALAEGGMPEHFNWNEVYMMEKVDLKTDRFYRRKLGGIRTQMRNIREARSGGFMQACNELWDFEADAQISNAVFSLWRDGVLWFVNLNLNASVQDAPLVSYLEQITPSAGVRSGGIEHLAERYASPARHQERQITRIVPSIVTEVQEERSYETWNYDVVNRILQVNEISKAPGGVPAKRDWLFGKIRLSKSRNATVGEFYASNMTELNAMSDERANANPWAIAQMILEQAVSQGVHDRLGHLGRHPINFMPFYDSYRDALSLVATPPPLNAVAGITFAESLSDGILDERFYRFTSPGGGYEYDVLGAILRWSQPLAAALAPPRAYANLQSIPWSSAQKAGLETTQLSLQVGFMMILAAIRHCYGAALNDLGLTDVWTESGWEGQPVREDTSFAPGNIKTALKRGVLRRWSSDPAAPSPWEVISAFDEVARVSFAPRAYEGQQLSTAFAPLSFLTDDAPAAAIEGAGERFNEDGPLRDYVMKRYRCLVPTKAGWETFLTLASRPSPEEIDPQFRDAQKKWYQLDKTATQWFQKTPAERKEALDAVREGGAGEQESA